MPRFVRAPIFHSRDSLLGNMPRKCSLCYREIVGKGFINFTPSGKNYSYLCKDCMIDTLQQDGALSWINPEFVNEGLESYGDIKLYYKNGGANLQVAFPSLREARDAVSKIRDMLGRYLLCECCGEKVSKLERHHWWEPPKYEYREKLVCAMCNQKHLTPAIWDYHPDSKNHERPPSHILPRWDLQVSYRRGEGLELLGEMLGEEYEMPLPNLREE